MDSESRIRPELGTQGSLRAQIATKIDELASDYRRAPATILTEDDLKCLLVHRLLEIPDLDRPRPTREPHVLGTRVHAEVSWFDENDKLCIRPDITVMDPRALSILHGVNGYRLPGKGFTFGGEAIILELKFVRSRGGLTRRAVAAVRRDLDKIRTLFWKLERESTASEVFCFFVVFSKVDRRVSEFDDLVARYLNDARFRLIYGSAGVGWPRA